MVKKLLVVVHMPCSVEIWGRKKGWALSKQTGGGPPPGSPPPMVVMAEKETPENLPSTMQLRLPDILENSNHINNIVMITRVVTRIQ